MSCIHNSFKVDAAAKRAAAKGSGAHAAPALPVSAPEVVTEASAQPVGSQGEARGPSAAAVNDKITPYKAFKMCLEMMHLSTAHVDISRHELRLYHKREVIIKV